MLLSPVTTILPKLRRSPMGNGDAVKTSPGCTCRGPGSTIMAKDGGFLPQWSFGTQVTLRGELDYNYLERAENGGNGEWRMWSSISVHAAWDAGWAHVLLACWGDNAAMETTMEEGNRQINLSSRI